MRLCHLRAFLPLIALGSTSVMAQNGIDVRSADGKLSVQASNVSASELATELSDELGIIVVVTGDSETRVNLDIVEEPLEKALAKLSPNNMLVRDDNAEDIIEVVLMMGEGEGSSQVSGSEQFLPSGSPAEEIPVEQDGNLLDETSLRDPDRVAQVREAAAAASSDANLPAEQVPPMFAEDNIQGGEGAQGEIDPATGLPFQQQQQ